MTSRKKHILIIATITAVVGMLIGVGIILHMFNMPHRDVQNAPTNYELTASQLVIEYLDDAKAANEKYLTEDGDSKILEITGTVAKVSEDYNGQKVVLLKESTDQAGVSCSFTSESNERASSLKVGEIVTIKGVIRSGASYDPDLEMYENVVLEKSDIIK